MTKILHFLSSQATKVILVVALLLFLLWLSGLSDLGSRLFNFPFSSLTLICLLLFTNLFLVAFRFWRILMHLSCKVPFAIASRAVLAGHFFGLLVFSLFGQVVGRQAILREIGIAPEVNAALAGYERGLLVLVSGTFALFGAIFLLDQNVVADFFGRFPVTEIFALIVFSLIISVKVCGSDFENRMLRRTLALRNVSHAGIACILTVASQFLVLSSFVVAILALQPGTHLISVFAAATLISFAASIPITINGWGVREVAAVFVLGKLDIPAADAVAVSILIGIASTLVVLAASFLVFFKKSVSGLPALPLVAVPSMALDLKKVAAWLIGTIIALLVLFQVHAGFNNVF